MGIALESPHLKPLQVGGALFKKLQLKCAQGMWSPLIRMQFQYLPNLSICSRILVRLHECRFSLLACNHLSQHPTTVVLWFQGRPSPTGGCKNNLNLIHLWLIRGKIMLYLGNNVRSLPVANRCYEILTFRFWNTEIQDKCFKLHSFWIHFELLIQRAHPNIN